MSTSNSKTPQRRRSGQYGGKAASTRQRERKAKLLAAGTSLIGRQGFAATSIDAVCREAGLTKRYFYESFASSDELLIQAYLAATKELTESILLAAAAHRDDPKKLINAGLRQTFGFVAAHPDKARLIMIEATSVRSQLGRVYGKSYGSFVELLLNFTKPFLPAQHPSDAELAVMARSVVGAIIHLCQAWLASDLKQPIDELVSGTERVLSGLGRELGIAGWSEPAV